MGTTITFEIPDDLNADQIKTLTDQLLHQVLGRKNLAANLDRIIHAEDVPDDDPAASYEFFRECVLDVISPIALTASTILAIERSGLSLSAAIDRVLHDCHPDEAHKLAVFRESIEAALLHTPRAPQIESVGGDMYVLRHADGSTSPIWEDDLPSAMRGEQ